MTVKIPKNVLGLVVNGALAVLNAVGLTTPNRIVVALSPFFVTASGYLAVLVANDAPGLPTFSSADLTAVFIAVATLAASKVLLWLHGQQAKELHAQTVPPTP